MYAFTKCLRSSLPRYLALTAMSRLMVSLAVRYTITSVRILDGMRAHSTSRHRMHSASAFVSTTTTTARMKVHLFRLELELISYIHGSFPVLNLKFCHLLSVKAFTDTTAYLNALEPMTYGGFLEEVLIMVISPFFQFFFWLNLTVELDKAFHSALQGYIMALDEEITVCPLQNK
jgi:hypothetical protein